VKQSYTTMRLALTSASVDVTPQPPEAYGLVEPQPELYRELKRQSAQLRLFLDALAALPSEVGTALQRLEEALERLTQISLLQLSGAALPKADQHYIKNAGATLLGIATGLARAVAPPAKPAAPSSDKNRHVVLNVNVGGIDDVLKAPLVADVHTDLNTRRVLEEGVGPIEWMLAVSRMPDGTLSVAVGPVFSTREFVHRLDDRLTNEKWRGALKSGQGMPAPRWWSDDAPIANGFQLFCTAETCKD